MVQIDDLSREIAKRLQQYTDEVTEEIHVARQDVAKKAVKALRKAGDFKDLTGDYRKGWRAKEFRSNTIIHNKTDYQLTHLLENGHVNRDGTRTEAYPHIRKAEEMVIEEYTDRVERAIKS